jgi:hypothetical protein
VRFYLVAVASLVLTASSIARADVTYTFTSTGGGPLDGTTFTIDSPDYLTYSYAPVLVTTGGDVILDGGDAGELLSVEFLSLYNILGITTENPQGLWFGGSYNVGVDGTYNDDLGDTLVISGTPDAVTSTPEPSSIVLLGTGLLGFAGVVKKRFA